MKRRGKGFWREGKEEKKNLSEKNKENQREKKDEGFQFDRSKEGGGEMKEETKVKGVLSGSIVR